MSTSPPVDPTLVPARLKMRPPEACDPRSRAEGCAVFGRTVGAFGGACADAEVSAFHRGDMDRRAAKDSRTFVRRPAGGTEVFCDLGVKPPHRTAHGVFASSREGAA